MKKRQKKRSEKRMRKTPKHKKKNLVIGLFAAGAVLVLVLVFLILSSFGVFKPSVETKMFSVQDECAIVMGSLIRQITDEGSCKIRCANECDVRSMEFESYEFSAQNSSCHICDCYCG